MANVAAEWGGISESVQGKQVNSVKSVRAVKSIDEMRWNRVNWRGQLQKFSKIQTKSEQCQPQMSQNLQNLEDKLQNNKINNTITSNCKAATENKVENRSGRAIAAQ